MTAQFSIREADPQIVARLAHDLGLPRFIATTLVARGITTVRAAKRFLSPSLDRDWRNPLEIPGLAEVADGLVDAIREKKRIVVFGDFDLDGISATTVLTRGLRALGACAFPFVPRRFEEGYGITAAAFERARALEPDVIVTVDCGIACKNEVADILKAGVEVYITDHHEAADLVPEGVPVADPKMADDCPSAILAGVGVALKLVQVLGSRLGFPHLWRSYTDFATLGTVADLMPMRDENRALVADGLARMNTNPRPCIAALLATTGQAGKPLSATNLSFSLIPRLNAAGRMGKGELALRLLREKDHVAAAGMAQELDELNLARRQEEERIYAEAKAQASDILSRGPRAGLVLYGKDWHPGIVGIVASRIVEDYYRPTIIVCDDQGSLKGSGRSVREFDLHGGLTRTADCLLNFGGHRQAAGVRLAPERLEEFRARFDAVAEEVLGPNPLLPSITLECELGFNLAGDHNFLKELELLQPFGPGNPEPVFQSPPLLVKERSFLGRSREHVLLRLTDSASGITLSAKAWRMADELPASLINKHILVAYTPRIDTYNGIASVDIAIKDWRPA